MFTIYVHIYICTYIVKSALVANSDSPNINVISETNPTASFGFSWFKISL